MRQEYQGDVGQVINGPVIHVSQKKEVPADPEVARICPQCEGLTWRRTQHCLHCGLDLFWHDKLLEDEARRVANQRLASTLSVLALLTFLTTYWVEGGWKLIPLGAALFLVSMVAALKEK